MKHIFRSVLVSSLLVFANSSQATQPQNGFWAIDGELTGQPGRGFQIDVQGETLVFSYYGYRQDGSATFYLSSGAYDVANGKYSGQLFEYQGGTPLGKPFRNGEEAGSAGNFSLQFLNSNRGYLSLPGEEKKPISRFTFSDPSSKFNEKIWRGEAFGIGPFYNDSTDFTFLLKDGRFNLRRDSFFSGTCIYDGVYSVHGEEIESNGSYKCSDFSEGSYSATRLKISEDGTYTGSIASTSSDGQTRNTQYHTAR